MGKAISEVIYKAWVKRMEPFLLCYDKNRLEHQYELHEKERAFAKLNHCDLSLNDDFNDAVGSQLK